MSTISLNKPPISVETYQLAEPFTNYVKISPDDASSVYGQTTEMIQDTRFKVRRNYFYKISLIVCSISLFLLLSTYFVYLAVFYWNTETVFDKSFVKSSQSQSQISLEYPQPHITSGDDEDMISIKKNINNAMNNIQNEIAMSLDKIDMSDIPETEELISVKENFKNSLNNIEQEIGEEIKNVNFPNSLQDFNSFDSKILVTEQAQRLLRSLISFDQKFSLLWRGSRDGFRAITFHKLCDGKPNTLTLIKSRTNYTFGGFTSVPWSKKRGYKADSQAFLFTLTNPGNNPLKLMINSVETAVRHFPTYGPIFGTGSDLDIDDLSNKKTKNCMRFASYEFPAGRGGREGGRFVHGGADEYFQTSEIEVFQIDL